MMAGEALDLPCGRHRCRAVATADRRGHPAAAGRDENEIDHIEVAHHSRQQRPFPAISAASIDNVPGRAEKA
jgi:hypothetical protein